MNVRIIDKFHPYRGGSFGDVDSIDAHRIREARRLINRLSDLTDYIDDYNLRVFGSLLIARYGQRNGVKQITLNIHRRESEV